MAGEEPAVWKTCCRDRPPPYWLPMKASPGHRLRALLLALVLALGMSLPFEGGPMAAEMAVAAEAAPPCPHGCDGCGAGDLEASTCLFVCGSAAQALVPGEPVALPPAARASSEAGRLVLGERSHSPEPGPPRPFTLG